MVNRIMDWRADSRIKGKSETYKILLEEGLKHLGGKVNENI